MSGNPSWDTGERRNNTGGGLLSRLLRLIRRVNETVVVTLFAALCVLVFSQVVARYVFQSAFSWSEEMARYFQVWLVLLASALCMQRGEHIAIDFLTGMLPARLRRALDITMNLIIIAYLLVVVGFSRDVLEVTRLQTSPAMQINMIVVYLSVPVGGSLILIESVVTLMRRLRGLEPYESVA